MTNTLIDNTINVTMEALMTQVVELELKHNITESDCLSMLQDLDKYFSKNKINNKLTLMKDKEAFIKIIINMSKNPHNFISLEENDIVLNISFDAQQKKENVPSPTKKLSVYDRKDNVIYIK